MNTILSHHKNMSTPAKEMIGQKYGRLTVLDYFYNSHKQSNICICLCECGKKTNVLAGHLRKGKTKSCGCINKEKFLDITGQTFGRLIVILPTSEKDGKNQIKWFCKCECGNTTFVTSRNLRTGNTQSCGCYGTDKRRQAKNKYNRKFTYLENLTYNTWYNMLSRCHGKSVPENEKRLYQDRGIVVCDKWRNSFNAFLEDMGERPSIEHSIDRINNDGNYEPGNCRWATAKIQANNARFNRILEFNGEKKNITQWQEFTGINEGTIRSRLKRGWTIEKTLTTPPIKF